MLKMLKEFVYVIALFLAIDIIWIKFYMANVYMKMVKNIQGENMKLKMYGGLITYILMTVLLIKFRNDSMLDMFLLGFLAYGVYDFTNYTIFTKWDLQTAIIDMVWGGILFAVVAKLSKMML
jgi:uncharacterized membrane protein